MSSVVVGTWTILPGQGTRVRDQQFGDGRQDHFTIHVPAVYLAAQPGRHRCGGVQAGAGRPGADLLVVTLPRGCVPQHLPGGIDCRPRGVRCPQHAGRGAGEQLRGEQAQPGLVGRLHLPGRGAGCDAEKVVPGQHGVGRVSWVRAAG